MRRPRIYVETTIPSLYYDTRNAPETVARCEWTRRWWETAQSRYELVTSAAVLDELAEGKPERSAQRISLVQGLIILPIEPLVIQIVETYIRLKVMPGDPRGDALHLALASYHKCDFLVTWNCRHLANANKFEHIRGVNAMLGLFVPELVAPLELLGGDDDSQEEV